MSEQEREQTEGDDAVDDLEVSDEESEEITGGGLSHGRPQGGKDDSV